MIASNSHDDIPWTIQQIRENSSKWTLEGDAKLLLYLEAFSNTLCKRSKTTKAKLDSMVSTLEYTQISLANSTNRFHALQHSQFVESRVYEEDIQADTCPKEEKVLQDSKIDPGVIAKQAVMCGLKLMENEYMKVQISANNSEQPRFKYVPKDRYMSRPLPLRIGSKEFLASLNPSESESEGGFGSSRSRSPSIASSQSKSYSPSLTNPSVQKYDISSITKGNSSILGHSSEEEDDKIFENSVEQHKSPNNKTSSDIDNTKNKREQFPTPRHSYPILFNDGPPLLEDLYEADKPKKNDLFDDDDGNSDELFDDKSKVKNIANKTSIIFHGQNENKSQAVNLFDEEPPEIDVSKTAQNIPKVTNLFDDDSEDDLFATVTSSHKNQVKANTYKSEDTVGIFSDKPPEIINSKLKGAIKKQIENIKTDVEDDILDSENTSNNITPKGTNIKTLQKNNLFEDDEDEIKFDTNLFNKNSLLSETSKHITFKLFDDEPPIDFEASSTSAKDENKKNKSFSIDKKFSLFSDSDDDDIFDSLIKNDSSDKSKSKVQVNPTITPKSEIKNIAFEASSNKIDPSTKLDSKQKSKINELFEDDDDLFFTKPVINVSKTNQLKKIMIFW
ncbi:WASH complex subunit 2-like [Ctenocephalides felis]|uniref:WASH complex subunit 2-like n=1 Tax=Ctenocephalides felis TaxID=7515 RepID=UPI000E6E285D|nr:WASH complex subunit 2-like [Ctenocephalides felis]